MQCGARLMGGGRCAHSRSRCVQCVNLLDERPRLVREALTAAAIAVSDPARASARVCAQHARTFVHAASSPNAFTSASTCPPPRSPNTPAVHARTRAPPPPSPPPPPPYMWSELIERRVRVRGKHKSPQRGTAYSNPDLSWLQRVPPPHTHPHAHAHTHTHTHALAYRQRTSPSFSRVDGVPGATCSTKITVYCTWRGPGKSRRSRRTAFVRSHSAASVRKSRVATSHLRANPAAFPPTREDPPPPASA